MRPPKLSTLLIAFNVGAVVVATLLVGIAGLTLLRRLGDEHAMAQVRLASTSAFQAVERSGARLLISARLLAERPTLKRYYDERRAAEAEHFLETFRSTSGLSGCGLMTGGRLFAGSSPSLPWNAVHQRAATEEGWLLLPRKGEPLLMAAWAPLSTSRDAEVIVVRALDEEYARETGGKVGFPVSILPKEEIEGRVEGPLGSLRLQALETDEPVSARIDEREAYFSAVSLRDRVGSVVGVVEASHSEEYVLSSERGLVRTLALAALAVSLLGALFSLFLARRIASPIEVLTKASTRIGRGNLLSPVPIVRGAEVETLSVAMEEMRERILELATDLRRKQAEAEAVLTGITEGVYAVDRERRIRYMNPQAAALLGADAGKAVGRFCGDVLRPRSVRGVRPCEENCPILHARFRGKANATEHLRPLEDRERIVVITSAPPDAEVAGADTEGTLQFQVIRDETEVEASRRLRDTVLANISHEFRTPLSAQLASLELLHDRLPDLNPKDLQELLLPIERGTLRLTRLIDNLLESSRIEAGEDSIRRHDVALDGVIEEATGLIAPLLEQRAQTLTVDLPYPVPAIQGDAPRLVQVFVNLLANANKFAPEGSPIRVGGKVTGGEIRLWVEDEGPGIRADRVDSLFERFARSTDEEPAPAGMGLGLFIVKSIVQRHGGRVEAETTGKGTRMTVILPCGGRDENPPR